MGFRRSSFRSSFRFSWAAFLFVLGVSSSFAGAAPKAKKAKAPLAEVSAGPALHLIAETPEQSLTLAVALAKTSSSQAIAGLVAIEDLATKLPRARLDAALSEIVSATSGGLRDEAIWMKARLSPGGSNVPGLLNAISILGPIADNEGGLINRSLEEAPEGAFTKPSLFQDWGVYQVRWRAVPTSLLSARGLALDLMIHPRSETCSYLASGLDLSSDTKFRLNVASAGSVRLSFDGKDIGISDEIHSELGLERIGAKVQAEKGRHLLVVKVCSGPLGDSGRIRVRASSEDGSGLDLPWTSSVADYGKGWTKSSSEELKLPLADAVKLGENSTISDALVAAMLRTMGGAEDLRSPKSSALLDRVVQAAGTDPELWATAAWATPMRGERTGRFNKSLVLSHGEQYAKVRSFALRQLAESRLDSNLGDWAMTALETPPLRGEADFEAKFLRARALAGMTAMRRTALRDMEALAKQYPDIPVLWSEIAETSSSFDRGLHLEALDRLASLWPEEDCPGHVKASMARGPEVIGRVVEGCIQRHAGNADELIAMGGVLRDGGHFELARKLYGLGTTLAPNESALWQGLSASAFASGDPADTQVAQAALTRARALEPADARLGAEIRLRAGGAAPGALDRDLVDSSVILARKAANPAQIGKVAERQLHWFRAVDYLEDHRVAQVIHYAREIVIEPRTQEELSENIPSEGDSTEILRARVHRAEGGVAFAEEQDSDPSRPRIRWPNLHRGDVVEVAIKTYTDGPVGRKGDPPFYFMDYAGAVETRPLLYNEVIVRSPVGHQIAVDVLHGSAEKTEDKIEGGRRIIRMVWEHPVNIADEPLAPHPSNVVPTLIGSTFGSWAAFLEWYRGAVKGFTEPDTQVRRLAMELTGKARTRDEKIRALFNYVADDIRYVNYQSGEFWLPNRPQEVLARRQGDCDDKAILLIALLKAVGIEATEVLIQTRMTAEESVLSSEKAAIPLFDHGIAYLPGKNGAAGMWLDATSPQSRLGPLPSMDARTFAIFADEGQAKIVATPNGSPSDHGFDAEWTIKLDTNGGGELEAKERHVGDHGFLLRENLVEAAARPQWVEQNLIAGWLPSVRLDKEIKFDSDVGQGSALIEFRAKSDGMARREGEELVVSLSPVSTMTGQLASLVQRTLPVVLPPHLAPSHQNRTVRIVAPEGYEIGDLPPGGQENGGEFGRASLGITVEGAGRKVVKVTRSVVIDMSTIPVAKYGAWRSWLQRVDGLMHRGLRFVPKGRKPRGKE